MEPEEDDNNKENQFFRACAIITELDTTIFRNILHCQIPPSDCRDIANKIRHIGSEQLRIARNVEVVGHYGDCDILLMFLLLTKGCAEIQPPTAGWGNAQVSGTTLGDDIQRIWEIKKQVISRRHSRTLERGVYKELLNTTHEICHRMDGDTVRFSILFSPFPSCVNIFNTILKRPLTQNDSDKNMYASKIEELAKREIEVAQEKENFAKMSQIVLDLNHSILEDILQEQLPPKDCPSEAAKLCPRPLSRDQLAIANDVPTNGYTECDTSLMYILLRNACKNIPPPTPGWTKTPTGLGIGDDIERIRHIRNKFGHSRFATLSNKDYKQLIQDTSDICLRFDTQLSHSKYTRPRRDSYSSKLDTIDTQSLDKKQQEEYTRKLEDMNMKNANIEETVFSMHRDMSSQIDCKFSVLMKEMQGMYGKYR